MPDKIEPIAKVTTAASKLDLSAKTSFADLKPEHLKVTTVIELGANLAGKLPGWFMDKPPCDCQEPIHPCDCQEPIHPCDCDSCEKSDKILSRLQRELGADVLKNGAVRISRDVVYEMVGDRVTAESRVVRVDIPQEAASRLGKSTQLQELGVSSPGFIQFLVKEPQK